MLSEVHAQCRAEAAQQGTRLRNRLDKESISWEVRVDEARLVEPARAMALQARYADLAVMTAPTPGADDAALFGLFFSALLFESGRPVLVIPPHHTAEFPLRHVMVAWEPCREATRALHDALPLMTAATSIDVVSVDPGLVDLNHGADPGTDIATHLARHGLAVNVIDLPGSEQTVAAALLKRAADSGAQLLVAGGYGHSRLREWVLGGTTRELLQAIPLPILFSH